MPAIGVTAVIVDDDQRVLLHRRRDFFVWALPGGRIEPGEPTESAAAREVREETGYEIAASLLRENPDVEGVYMPCNKWRITSVIERIEKEFGKPVVTNTQAWVLEALRGMGIAQPIPGFGRLLR